MLDGLIFDQGNVRIKNIEELLTYCYRVAGTVGLMVLPVLGTSTTHTLEEAIPPGLSLGIAFQITNILRDVGEDALRGRIYLPREDMARFGVTEEQIIKGVLDENYKDLMKFEIQRARDYYVEAEAGGAGGAPGGVARPTQDRGCGGVVNIRSLEIILSLIKFKLM